MQIVTNVVHVRIIENGAVRASASARLNMDLLEKGNLVRIPFHLLFVLDIDLHCVESLCSHSRYYTSPGPSIAFTPSSSSTSNLSQHIL